ncbi:hypothetical protein EVAR_21251_1 [Eumeta japonica]|uniref:Uncharacterized protein n=1 Tax=Eumeta variegata TaxID=151549 RepID=A0A4C1WLH7_EUMVA|nr:hypothetical protein EVAR_21251_1 [Eumeta japonica]
MSEHSNSTATGSAWPAGGRCFPGGLPSAISGAPPAFPLLLFTHAPSRRTVESVRDDRNYTSRVRTPPTGGDPTTSKSVESSRFMLFVRYKYSEKAFKSH